MAEVDEPTAYEETPEDGEWVLEDDGWVFVPAPGFADTEA